MGNKHHQHAKQRHRLAIRVLILAGIALTVLAILVHADGHNTGKLSIVGVESVLYVLADRIVDLLFFGGVE